MQLLLWSLPLALLSAAPGDDWLEWRGPNRHAVVEGDPWPADLSPDHLTELWRLPELGASYSGTIVLGDTVFTTESRDSKIEAVMALDRATGDRRWRVEWPCTIEITQIGRANGDWIRATPACDGETLFVGGMRDVLIALDVKTGEERWRLDFPEQTGSPVPEFGFVSSPLVHGDAVYVQAGEAFAKVDKKTGKLLWKTLDKDGTSQSVFSCPIVVTLGGEEQLVVQTRKVIAGVNFDGEVLWSHPTEADYECIVTTPVVAGERIFTGPYGRRSMILDASINLGQPGPAQGWKSRSQGYMSTPVVVGEHLYLYNQANRFSCIPLADGKPTWISPPTEDKYWSLVAQGDRILALANDGVLRLIAADPAEYRVIDEVTLTDDETWAHLTVVDGELYVREQGALVAYSWK